MKPGTACLLLALGAILAFAVTVKHFSGFDVHAVGVILLMTGVLGLVLSPGATSRLRSRFMVRSRPERVIRVDPPELEDLSPGDITAAQEAEDYLNRD
jgi:hypothetical protein